MAAFQITVTSDQQGRPQYQVSGPAGHTFTFVDFMHPQGVSESTGTVTDPSKGKGSSVVRSL